MLKTSDITPEQFYKQNENQDFNAKHLDVFEPVRQKAREIMVKAMLHEAAITF